MIIHILSLILLIFINDGSSRNCYQDYPLILGDSSRNSYFQALDMDPKQNLIAGGGIEVTASVFRPLVAYAKSISSSFQWSFIITDSDLNSVIQVKFRNLIYDKAAILIKGNSNQPVNIVIADLTSKTIQAYYRKPAV